MSVTKRFKVAAVQTAPIWMNAHATVDKACTLISEAARMGACLVAFPEVFIPAYPYWNWIMMPFDGSPYFKELYSQAVSVPDNHTEKLCCCARKNGVYVVIGVNERSLHGFGTLFNTNIIISPEGRILGKHRKLVPTWAEKLTWGWGDGSTLRVYETEIGKVGTLICGENTNTLARFALLAQGEQIHIANYPATPWVSEFNMVEAIKIRSAAHSLEGKVFTVVSSSILTPEIIDSLCCTERQREIMCGRPNALSGIFGPTGAAVSDLLIDEEGIVYAEIDLDSGLVSKQMHDITGSYNRFDIFTLCLDRTANEPLSLHDDGSNCCRTGLGELVASENELPASSDVGSQRDNRLGGTGMAAMKDLVR